MGKCGVSRIDSRIDDTDIDTATGQSRGQDCVEPHAFVRKAVRAIRRRDGIIHNIVCIIVGIVIITAAHAQ